MASWAWGTTVTFRHGRVERRELNSIRDCPTFLDTKKIAERNNTGGPHHVPGIGIGTNFEREAYAQFSHGFGLWTQDRLSNAEIAMIRIINKVTDRKNWHIDIDDYSICLAWKKDAASSSSGSSTISDALWDWCTFELRKKAKEFSGLAKSVFVLDAASRVCKSDRLAGTEFLKKLAHNTRRITVCPWLYPFQYGKSPVRTDGVSITLDNITHCIGRGTVPSRPFWYDADDPCNGRKQYYSNKWQWVATDVKFTGETKQTRIVSPINNLHPVKHKFIYEAVESLIFDSVSTWNQILLYKALPRGISRVKPQSHRCLACSEEKPLSCSCKIELREYSDWVAGKDDAKGPQTRKRWNPIAAMDGYYESSNRIYDNISLSDAFQDRGFQVYVEVYKLEMDSDGFICKDGSHRLDWNLNGNRNERIVATTLLCLHRNNVTPLSGGISFRSEIRRDKWEEYGIKSSCRNSDDVGRASASTTAGSEPRHDMTPTFQQLGTVTLQQGRIVTFPNALQHRFEAPVLQDASRPGYIQLLEIHLVDPHYILCSTRHAPPQSLQQWWESSGMHYICEKRNIPPEVRRYIVDHTIGPDRSLEGKQRWTKRRRYWPRVSTTGKPLPPPPLRQSTADRIKRKALDKHARVMQAVNGPRFSGTPSAADLWYQAMAGQGSAVDNGDASGSAPTFGSIIGLEDPPEGEYNNEDELSEVPDEEYEESEDDSENESSAEESGVEDEEGNDEGDPAPETESDGDEEFHDAVFYYFVGEMETQAQEAQNLEEATGVNQEDIFYDALLDHQDDVDIN